MRKHILSKYAINFDSNSEKIFDDPTIITMAIEDSDEDEFNMRGTSCDSSIYTATVESTDEDESFQ